MFLVKPFRTNQMKPVWKRLINADLTPERHFVELYLDGVLQYCLLHNMKVLIFQVKRQSLGNGVAHSAIVLTQSRLMQILSSHPGY